MGNWLMSMVRGGTAQSSDGEDDATALTGNDPTALTGNEDAHENVDAVKRDAKLHIVERGLRLGEFHAANNASGLDTASGIARDPRRRDPADASEAAAKA